MSSVQQISRYKCTGCAVCIQVCPAHCITMESDIEGFLYPQIDCLKCLGCGQCLQICPIVGEPSFLVPTEGYAAVCTDDRLYDHSSSGGIFALIARHIIERDGFVCGAAVVNGPVVKHILVGDMEDLKRIQGSKYVQSDLREVLRPIKEKLESGETILFSGTPCQVMALKKMLGKDYDSLFTVDIVCHGVPSPGFFVKHIRQKFGDDVSDVIFRVKTRYEVSGYDLKVSDHNKKTLSVIPAGKDEYYNLFLHGLSFREACYHCPYARIARVGDVSLGDCGSGKIYADRLPPMKAISTVLVNSAKGRFLWHDVCERAVYCVLDVEKEVACNAQLQAPTKRPVSRDSVYIDLMKEPYNPVKARPYMSREPFHINVKAYLKRKIPLSIRYKIKALLKRAKA